MLTDIVLTVCVLLTMVFACVGLVGMFGTSLGVGLYVWIMAGLWGCIVRKWYRWRQANE